MDQEAKAEDAGKEGTQYHQSQIGLFNAVGTLRPEKWKSFKRDYNITKATMNVLLEQLGEEYFGHAKHIRYKNKKAIDLSPYAAKFFKVFLQKQQEFRET